MTEFLQKTAWMYEKPSAYGAFHLCFFFIGLAVVTILALLLRKSNEKTNKIVLTSVGVFLILTEIYKQLFYTLVIGGGQYQWWIFPFQLCSVPMYLCVIAPWLPDGRFRNSFYDFLLSFNLMGGFVAFIEPSGLLHEYVTLTLHAFVWHMTLVFVGLYLGFSRRAGRRLKDFKFCLLTFASLCVIAFAINLIFRKVAAGDINMFYVGPSNSPIIVFKDISEKLGWYVNTPIYIACLSAAAFIFFFPFCLYNKRADKQKQMSASDVAKDKDVYDSKINNVIAEQNILISVQSEKGNDKNNDKP